MGIYEKRQKRPIMPLDLFKNKVRFGAYLVRALFMMAKTSNFYVSLGWMAGFSLVALLIVIIFIYQFGKNP